MKSRLDTKQRILKLQKMRQEKAERELAFAQRQKHAIAVERASLLAALDEGSVAERLFPKLTYDRLRTLETSLKHMEKHVAQKVQESFSESKKLEKTRDGVREERARALKEFEAIEQSEQIDLRASKYGQSTGSGKIADLD
ncbi:hypothetical protein [Ahrensia kielensis]|uniref:hypothetical protein n=1 Tax=Ahrensia kielensis TaxID=76980 RepID=UPI000374D7B8|nr:hypothetical protein [Ahrensia kielensis]